MGNNNGVCLTRRGLLASVAVAGLSGGRVRAAAPASTVAVGRCATYGTGVRETMRKMFDQIGGIGKLVSGKTVAIKINMSGPLRARLGSRPAWYTHWTHPEVIGAAVSLIGEAGATRIRIVEGSTENDFPLEENFIIAGWDPGDLLRAAPKVEMENTGALGYGTDYARLDVPDGGLIYPAFDFNHSYQDCDVMVSLAKLKENQATGVSLSLKNMVGTVPGCIYGDSAGDDGPAIRPFGAFSMFHNGNRQPPLSAPAEKNPGASKDYGYRVPRITVDVVRARPVHLAIIDGIESQTASEVTTLAEGSKRKIIPVTPGVLLAGFNPVCVDAVASAVMGFDPMAGKGSAPFEKSDNSLQLAEAAGIGSCDLKKIEVAGVPVSSVRFPFRAKG